jgi:hypothetical protein
MINYRSRLNINNVDYTGKKEKRDRALNYWQSRVISNFLPPIDQRKRAEINMRILKIKNQMAPNINVLRKMEIEQKKKDSLSS